MIYFFISVIKSVSSIKYSVMKRLFICKTFFSVFFSLTVKTQCAVIYSAFLYRNFPVSYS